MPIKISRGWDLVSQWRAMWTGWWAMRDSSMSKVIFVNRDRHSPATWMLVRWRDPPLRSYGWSPVGIN